MKKASRFIVLAMVAGMVGLVASPASADTLFLDMETYITPQSTFVPQDGWTNGNFELDHFFVNNTYGYPSFGTKSLRISNGTTNGNLAHTLSKNLTNDAGEDGANTDGGQSDGTYHEFFSFRLDLASTVPGAQQPGLGMSLSPDNGSGARMSHLAIFDDPTGWRLQFFDYQRAAGNTCPGSFVPTNVATGLDRSVPHVIELQMLFVNGIANDVVTVLVDGTQVHQGGSWEESYRCGGAPTNTVDALRFLTRPNTGTAPATLGNGFLFDNITLCSGDQADCVAAPPTAQERKTAVRDSLEAKQATADEKDAKRIGKAIEHIEKSQNPEYWDDDTHLDPKQGDKVFKEEQKAVKELMKVENTDVSTERDELVAIDRELAQTEVDEAPPGDERTKAEEEMAKGDAEAAADEDDKAIEHYRKAWEHAIKAQS